MKTKTTFSIKALLITFTSVFMLLQSVSSQTFTIDNPFTSIKVEGALTVYIQKSETNSIIVEKSEEGRSAEEMFQYSVNNGELNIKATNKVKDLHLLVNYARLESLTLSGVPTVISRNAVSGDAFTLKADGASDGDLELDVNSLTVNASGASTLNLKGSAQQADVTASGAADVKAWNMNVKNASIAASGAADVKMHVSENATVKASGASDVKLKEKPVEVTTEVTGASTVKYGEEVVENNFLNSSGSTSDGKKKFDGHWGGIELGVNTFVDKSFNSGLTSEYGFLELNIPKSITVQLNLFEQNVPIVSNKFGMVTGLGLWMNNYRFSNNIVLVSDSSTIYGFADTTKNYIKSKLTATYLVLPLLFEYQFRDKGGKELLHVAAGAYGAVKLGSKTKTVYLHSDTKIKTKDHGNYKLNPFKYGLTARIGWRKLNFFGNYNLSTLFENNKGPELYPFEVGITLAGW